MPKADIVAAVFNILKLRAFFGAGSIEKNNRSKSPFINTYCSIADMPFVTLFNMVEGPFPIVVLEEAQIKIIIRFSE